MSEQHQFKKNIAGKAYCVGCSLVRLHNDLTDWCVKRGCDYSEHQGYKTALATLPERYRARR